jgi:hypothetical protein
LERLRDERIGSSAVDRSAAMPETSLPGNASCYPRQCRAATRVRLFRTIKR